ncbi:hypothetical protein PG995_016414 [Apiospora arundinis]
MDNILDSSPLLWPRDGGSSSALCPDGNNTKATDSKGLSYNLLCGTSIIGNDIGSSPVAIDSLSGCMDLCTSSQGLCAGVTHNGTYCWRKKFVGQSSIKAGFNAIDNSAVAIVPPASADDCARLGSCYQSSQDQSSSQDQQKHGFQIFCGNDYKRDDLAKVYAPSMASCIDSCTAAAPQGCVGVAYQSGNRGNGVLNCYLKNGTDTNNLVDGKGYGTSAAFMLSLSTNNGVSTPSSTNATPPPTVSSSSSGTATGAIAGAAVGGVAGLAALCLVIFLLLRRRKRDQQTSEKIEDDSQNNNHQNNNDGGLTAPPYQNAYLSDSAKQHLPPAPSSAHYNNDGYAVSTPSTMAGAYHQYPQEQQQQQYQQQQQQQYYAPPQEQKEPQTFTQAYYEVDAAPRAVEVEAPMGPMARPNEMADQSLWSNHEPKTLMPTSK